MSSIVLTHGSGAARGFDFYDDAVGAMASASALGNVQREGGETAARLEGWLGSRVSGPFLAFLHLYEPHAPYEPPEPFKSRYAARPYDGEIAAADAVLGRFLAFLKEKGAYDRALIVVFSDHGEGLGEHGEDEHGYFLYRETLQVPLLLKLPGSKDGGTSVKEPAALSDIFPTALRVVGVESPPLPEGPQPLTELARKDAPRRIFSETYFPRIHLGFAELASDIEGSFHYIDAPRPELYDVTNDPAERTDLAPQKTAELRTLRLDVERRRQAFAKPGAVDPEEKKKLTALGYVSAGGTESNGALPDPKDGIETFRSLRAAFTLETEGKEADATRAFQALLERNPRMLDVWEAYSRCLFRLGRADDSLAAMKKTVEIAPSGATSYLVSVAELALQMGRLDDAEANARLAKERGDETAANVLARAALVRRDLAKAEEWATEARGHRGQEPQALMVLARVAAERGDGAAALARLDEADAAARAQGLAPVRSLRQLRGDVFARGGRPAEAEAELLGELHDFPSNATARVALAALYGAGGRVAEARRVLETLLEDSPTPFSYDTAARLLLAMGDRPGAEDVKRRARTRFGGRNT